MFGLKIVDRILCQGLDQGVHLAFDLQQYAQAIVFGNQLNPRKFIEFLSLGRLLEANAHLAH